MKSPINTGWHSVPLSRLPRAEHFTGRERELAQLLESLQPDRAVILCGPDGIGKTALAAEALWTLAPADDPPDRFPDGIITHSVAVAALSKLEVDPVGLDEIDHKVLHTIIDKFNGGPVGLDTIAASISEESDTITDVYEPYLMQLGFLERTPRGRLATPLAYQHLGLPYNKKPPQPTLL